MIAFVKNSAVNRLCCFETGIVHQMMKDAPDKEFLWFQPMRVAHAMIVHFMKMNTLEKLYLTLQNVGFAKLVSDPQNPDVDAKTALNLAICGKDKFHCYHLRYQRR